MQAARHKMALLIWLAIYPTINLLFWVLGPIIDPLPLYLKTLVITLILVPLMVYVFLPGLNRMFAKWLSK